MLYVTCGDTTFPMQLEDTVIPSTDTYMLLDKIFQMTSFTFQKKTYLLRKHIVQYACYIIAMNFKVFQASIAIQVWSFVNGII